MRTRLSVNLYQVEVTSRAEKSFKKLPPDIQRRIARKIDLLVHNPRPVGVVKLSGEDSIYRLREGDYRICYAIQDKVLLVLVVKITHRREVYRD